MSVVVPVFRDAASLPDLVRRVGAALAPRGGSHEILLVLDGGPEGDRTAALALRDGGAPVRVLELDGNHGQHSAILCGLAESRGLHVVTLDADLQNPPEEIPRLLDVAAEGFDGVFGAPRVKRHGPVRRAGSWLVQAMLVPLHGKPRGLAMTNFRVLTRATADAAVRRAGRWPYLQGLLLESGGRWTSVAVDHAPRERGDSTYGWLRLAGLFTRAVVHTPRLPIRLLLRPWLKGPAYRLRAATP